MNILVYSNNLFEYQIDLIIHGLTSLGHHVTLTKNHVHLFKNNPYNVDIKSLYGYGFSISFLIDENLLSINENLYEVKEQISAHYYDFIIIDITNGNLWIKDIESFFVYCKDFYKSNNIFIIDGSDNISCTYLLDVYPAQFLYFKRDLIDGNLLHININTFPISYCIPKEKFMPKDLSNKDKLYINDYSYDGMVYDKSKEYHYQIDSEEEFYKRLNTANFVLTGKKGGFCRMMYYEILAAYSLPVFVDYQYIPRLSMTFWPSWLQAKANNLYHTYIFYHNNDYFNIYVNCLNEFYDYAYEYLTTERIAKYLLTFL